MKILYIGFFSLPDHDAAANRVLNNAKAIKLCGHEVIFIDEQVDYIYDDFFNSVHSVQGFDTWSLRRPNGSKGYLKKMVDVDYFDYLNEYYNGIDLVIAYNYPSIALKRLLLKCRREKIRLAADCTEWYLGQEYSFPINIICAVDSFYRMRSVHKQLDGLIVISSFLANFYSNQHIVFVPPLVDISEKIWNQPLYNWDKDRINLIYSGNPGKSKESLLPIVEAINNCNIPVTFRVVGITKERFLELYPDTENLLNDNILFLGRVTHSDNIRLVKSSDYLVFLRKRNRVSMAGFSTKFVEAVTCNTAVITTDTGDLKKYITGIVKRGTIINDQFELNRFLNKAYQKKDLIEKEPNSIFDFHDYSTSLNRWLDKIEWG